MDMTVNNRFAILLAQKRIDARRNLPLSEVAAATGIPRKTLYAWANNTVTRYDAGIIDALCEYFSCQPGDLFYLVENGKTPLETDYETLALQYLVDETPRPISERRPKPRPKTP